LNDAQNYRCRSTRLVLQQFTLVRDMLKVRTKRNWEIVDHSKPEAQSRVDLVAGEYELERIPHPYGDRGHWLILRGTTFGASENWWRDWSGCEDDFQIVVEEDGVQLQPVSR
jgi:hypothetical protein